MSFVLLLYLACLSTFTAYRSSLLGMRLRGRHALFPPRGEYPVKGHTLKGAGRHEKREKRDLKRHL